MRANTELLRTASVRGVCSALIGAAVTFCAVGIGGTAILGSATLSSALAHQAPSKSIMWRGKVRWGDDADVEEVIEDVGIPIFGGFSDWLEWSKEQHNRNEWEVEALRRAEERALFSYVVQQWNEGKGATLGAESLFFQAKKDREEYDKTRFVIQINVARNGGAATIQSFARGCRDGGCFGIYYPVWPPARPSQLFGPMVTQLPPYYIPSENKTFNEKDPRFYSSTWEYFFAIIVKQLEDKEPGAKAFKFGQAIFDLLHPKPPHASASGPWPLQDNPTYYKPYPGVQSSTGTVTFYSSMRWQNGSWSIDSVPLPDDPQWLRATQDYYESWKERRALNTELPLQPLLENLQPLLENKGGDRWKPGRDDLNMGSGGGGGARSGGGGGGDGARSGGGGGGDGARSGGGGGGARSGGGGGGDGARSGGGGGGGARSGSMGKIQGEVNGGRVDVGPGTITIERRR